MIPETVQAKLRACFEQAEKPMSETKHTPGPWINDLGEFVRHPLDEFTSVHVATIYGASGIGEAQANARLIAAAPELLEMLKRAAGGLRNLIEVGKLTGGWADDAKTYTAEYDAVIAKAEGAAS